MKSRFLCLLFLQAFLLPFFAAAEEFNLPDHLTVIHDSAFQDIEGIYWLTIPNGISRIGSKAFAGTEITNIEFPGHALPYDTVQKDSFDWDLLFSVRLCKGDPANPDREKDLYDFFLEIQEEQAQRGHEIIVTRSDPFVTCDSNVRAAFGGTEVVLSAYAEGLFGTVEWQWQEKQSGSEDWTDCKGGRINQTARDQKYAFTAGEGMARQFRATALLDDNEQYISENIIEILFLRDDEVNFNLLANPRGTSVQLSWNPDLKDLVEFTLTMAEISDGQDERTELVSDEITETDYIVDLLKAETDYKFTVTAVTPGREMSDSITARTGSAPAASETVFRALLIGEVDFPNDECTRNFGDVKWMRRMLRQAKGCTLNSDGGMYGIVVKKDLSQEEILDAIGKAFGAADENDVSLLFIASHGDTRNTGDKAGSIATVEKTDDGMTKMGNLYLKDLADSLLQVEGELNIFLGSCGSGAAVISDEDAAKADGENPAEAFTNAAVRAFAKAAEEAGELEPRTGEFRNERFRVLTAAAYHQMSWGWEGGDDPHNDFAEYVVDGVLKGAATNEQGQITLDALYRYIREVGDERENIVIDDEGEEVIYYQNVQVYPENCQVPLFIRSE